jgi:uncharacterized membrane protein YphA (DoxX/SURF4 family)
LHRLYSRFPGGLPGMGLLFLRVAISVTLMVEGADYLSALQDLSIHAAAVCLLTLASGVSLLIGLVTPLASAAAILASLCITFLPLPTGAGTFFNATVAFNTILIAVALALLGPGAFSLDVRLFGRRTIIIPRSPTSSKY